MWFYCWHNNKFIGVCTRIPFKLVPAPLLFTYSFPPPFIRPVCTYCDRAKLVLAPTFSRFQYRYTDLFFISTHIQNLSINKNLNKNYLFKKSPFFNFLLFWCAILFIHLAPSFFFFLSFRTNSWLLCFSFCVFIRLSNRFMFPFYHSMCLYTYPPPLCSRTTSFSTTFFLGVLYGRSEPEEFSSSWPENAFGQRTLKHFWAADLKTSLCPIICEFFH